jgi:hypothetical protein
MESARTATTRVNRITLRDDDIIFIEIFPDLDFQKEDAIATLRACDELTGGRVVSHCVDMRKVKSMDRPTREVFAHGKNTRAAALIIGNPLSRILGNFFLGLNRPICPTKLFNEVDAGLVWLRTLE